MKTVADFLHKVFSLYAIECFFFSAMPAVIALGITWVKSLRFLEMFLLEQWWKPFANTDLTQQLLV